MNRKKILFIITLLTIMSLTVFHLKMNKSVSKITDISLSNMNALAQESDTLADCISVKGFCVINDNVHTDQMGFK